MFKKKASEGEGRKSLVGIYPGTFDPPTKGHLQLIRRASRMVDRLVIGVAKSESKKPLFSMEERAEMVRADIENMPGKDCKIEVVPFDMLLVELATSMEASFIFRGLRAVSDFEYEFQLTGLNTRLNPNIETVFLMAADKWQFVSSSFVKEIARMNGDISEFVTPQVQAKLLEIYKK